MRNRTLACVFAHPDDDAYGAAGSVALHTDEPDFRFVLIHATFGEHGDMRDGFPATRETLGSIRQAEDEAARRALGRAPDRHKWLGLPDGGVADVPFDELVTAVAGIWFPAPPTAVFASNSVAAMPTQPTRDLTWSCPVRVPVDRAGPQGSIAGRRRH